MPNKPQTHSERTKRAYGRQLQDKQYERNVREVDPGLREAKHTRSSGRYRRFRNWFVKKHPLCCDPFAAHPDEARATAEVHHIKELSKAPELATVEQWCTPVCTSCHSKISGMERRGEPTEHLFSQYQEDIYGISSH